MTVKIKIQTMNTVVEFKAFGTTLSEASKKISVAISKDEALCFPGEKTMICNPKHIVFVTLQEVADDSEV